MTDKLKVFLDSNILIQYFKGDSRLKDLFSSNILNKVQFAINPIVFQEILLLNNRIDGLDFYKLENNLKILSIDEELSEDEIAKLKSIRNYLSHANDFLIISSSIKECDYLLTMDKELLKIGKIESLKIIDPDEFFNIHEVKE